MWMIMLLQHICGSELACGCWCPFVCPPADGCGSGVGGKCWHVVPFHLRHQRCCESEVQILVFELGCTSRLNSLLLRRFIAEYVLSPNDPRTERFGVWGYCGHWEGLHFWRGGVRTVNPIDKQEDISMEGTKGRVPVGFRGRGRFYSMLCDPTTPLACEPFGNLLIQIQQGCRLVSVFSKKAFSTSSCGYMETFFNFPRTLPASSAASEVLYCVGLSIDHAMH